MSETLVLEYFCIFLVERQAVSSQKSQSGAILTTHFEINNARY